MVRSRSKEKRLQAQGGVSGDFLKKGFIDGEVGPKYMLLPKRPLDPEQYAEDSFKEFPLEPLYDRLIVQRVEAPTTTEGGLLVPEMAKEKAQEGFVLSVGAGRLGPDGTQMPMSVKPGDRVFFGKYAGTEITISRVTYLILREDEVLGRLRTGLGAEQYMVPTP
jgi:chaperonin GroES